MNPTTFPPNLTNIHNIIDNDLSDSQQSITKKLLEKYKPKIKGFKVKPTGRVLDVRDAA